MLRRNTEDIMFKKLRLKIPKEAFLVKKSISSIDFWALPGFIVHHDSDRSHVIITHRNKLNYLIKFLFECFFPHSNEYLVNKVLFIGIIIDTRKHFQLNINLFKEIALARDISLIHNDDEMIPDYTFFFSSNLEDAEAAKNSFLVDKERNANCFLEEEININDLEYMEKLQLDPKYTKKIKSDLNNKILPLITNENYNFIKREYVEKKLFKKFKLSRVKEKFIVNSGVKTKRIIKYPGFDLMHSTGRSLIYIHDKEKLNYVLKFVYEMFCPRENKIMSDVVLYKELNVSDITFTSIAEDDFERIYPFIKNTFTILLIHNEKENPLNYLFTFVDDNKALSDNPLNINNEFIEKDDYELEELDTLEQEFDKAILLSNNKLHKDVVTAEDKQKKSDVLPKILMSSRLKLEQLNASLLGLEERESDEELTEEEWEDLDDDEKEIKKKEKKLNKQKNIYVQKLEALMIKKPKEKGPIGEPDEDKIQYVTAPIEKPYKLHVGVKSQRHIKQNLSKKDAYGDFEVLGFKLQHFKTYTIVDLNPDHKKKDFLLKFLYGIFIIRDLPKTEYEHPPYVAIVLDGVEYREFSEQFAINCLKANIIKLIWDPNKFAPDYHI